MQVAKDNCPWYGEHGCSAITQMAWVIAAFAAVDLLIALALNVAGSALENSERRSNRVCAPLMAPTAARCVP